MTVPYSGQKITVAFKSEKKQGSEILMSFYVRKSSSKKEIISKTIKLKNTDWQTLDWTIPDTGEEAIDEIGLKFENFTKDTYIGNFYVDNILIDGKGRQKINFSKEIEEFGGVSPFTFNRGKWTLENGKMKVICQHNAEAYTGNYYTGNVEIKAIDNKFTVKINGKTVIEAQDSAKSYFKYGVSGYSLLQGGRAAFEKFEAKEI